MKMSSLLLVLMSLIATATNAGVVTTNHYLLIYADVPPAIISVIDSSGNLAGVDQTKSLNGLGSGTSIQNIPGSWVMQNNSSTDVSSGGALPGTSWSIYISDQPAQSYTVNLLGNGSDSTYLGITGGYALSVHKSDLGDIQLPLLISTGITKTAQISYDPNSGTITAAPIINNGDFLRDTQFACSLGAISPAEACEVLDAIASEAEKSINQGSTNSEAIELNLYLLVLNQLHNWGNAGSIQNWGNCNGYSECLPLCNKGLNGTIFFAKDPAYSALELDAQTLLNALPNQGISQGGGNQRGGNQGGNQGGQGNQGSSNQGGGNQGGSNEGGQGNNGGSNQGGGNQGSGQGSNGNQGSGGNQGGQENQGGGNQGNH